jgi:hypothetical protein
MRTLPKGAHRDGFTARELLMVVLCLFILALVLIPLNRDSPKKKIVQCQSNLREIGRGFLTWAHDNPTDTLPIWVSKRDGGTMEYQQTNEVFRHFQILTNRLEDTKFLICPADTERKPARNFSAFENKNLSYFINLKAPSRDNYGIFPTMPISGDRNLIGGIQTNHLMLIESNSPIRWTSAIHNQRGNVLIEDGSARTWGPSEWRSYLDNLTPFRIAIP